MTQHITIATFHGQEDVDKTMQDLLAAGIDRAAIRVSNEVAGDYSSTVAPEKGFWESLGDFFMPDDDRSRYTNAHSSGGILMTVTSDEEDTYTVEDILQEFGVLEQTSDGVEDIAWSDTSSAGSMARATTDARLPMGVGMDRPATQYTGDTARTGDNDVLSVMEEDIQVGKRQVSGGRLKVRSYTVETPYSEDVSLRTETVDIIRNPVDRPAGPGDLAFQDGEIEAEAMSEEAVVSKSARVVEEISLRKTATERSQTVTDTLRSTEVDIVDEDGNIAEDSLADRR